MKVTFKSWDQRYKRPFGAIQANTEVTWSVKVEEEIQEVTLWLTKVNEDAVAYPLSYNSDTEMYETSVKIGSSGLYYYYFNVKQNDQYYFLQRSQDGFGDGEITQDNTDLRTFQLTCYDRTVPQAPWYTQGVVYQIFPDRFNNGNPNGEITGRKKDSFIYATKKDSPYYIKDERGDIARWDFFGGNLEGIRQKIPYLKQLGVTAIYLNPIFLASSNHRYDTQDFLQIDPMLGTEEDFKKLVHDLHQNKIALILDGVFNHVGADSKYFLEAINDKNSKYFSWFNFIHYPDKYQSWWGVTTLPEVNKHNKDYQDFICGPKGVLAKWTRMHVDGWRLDVADELPMQMLREIRERLQNEDCHVLIGEVWEDASHKFVNSEFRTYMAGDNLTGTMNYPIRNFIIDLLQAKNEEDELSALNDLEKLVENYPKAFLENCMNNIGTHDTPRIKTVLGGDEDLVSLAFGLLFSVPGVPCVYYGDEAGLEGDKDPDNRRYFPWGEESQLLERKVARLASLRKQNPALVNGKVGFVKIAFGINALVRYNIKEVVVYCYNKTDQDVILDAGEFQTYCLPEEIAELVSDILDQESLLKKSDMHKTFLIAKK
ncbi:MAG: glycoside hydrolase family 13 protein [Lactobacillus equicursoris]|uniref:glycoside hydrolase family 13 protein n=1 Tax=Lactobacillus equicursoris TaxID=420645 RepID=UPI00242D19CD|nr:glycoside hydrolase family 13 protein [Lactobacillus equicursoris]MDD6407203.1 glycoside hydrolase family 13 protein [Lactobacillus equicursoris]